MQTASGTVVDLSEVGFLDSSGINVLISAHQAAEARGVWFRLAAPSTRSSGYCAWWASTP
ncbi:STAS domain-containing protein [Streptomyces shaanxiensis]